MKPIVNTCIPVNDWKNVQAGSVWASPLRRDEMTIKIRFMTEKEMLARIGGYLALYGDKPYLKPRALGTDKEEK